MPGPVDGSQGVDQSQSSEGTPQEEPDYGFDRDYSSTRSSRTSSATGTRPKYSSYPTPGSTGPTGASFGTQPGTGGISPGGEFGMPGMGLEPEVNQFIQNLKNQGYTPEQIQQQVRQQFGVDVPLYDIDPGITGQGSARGPNKYGLYAASPMPRQYGSYSGGFGSTYLQQYLQQQQMVQQSRESARAARSHGRKEMVKMHMILLLIMMGDVVGALRAYTAMMDRDFRQFARGVMDKLGKVRQARARVIRNFASERPPRAYAGDNPQSAARAQDQAQRYTQFVQLSTQLMGELQTTERELVDILQTMKRDIDNFWQAYASMRDAEGRVNERLMTTR